MNKINQRVNHLNSYFKPIKEFKQHIPMLGILKIMSYFTIIIPCTFFILAQCAALKKRKLTQLIQRVESDNSIIKQIDLLKYAILKISDQDIEKFKIRFKELDKQSQEQFFLKMFRKNQLQYSLSNLPEGLKSLSLSCGMFGTSDSRVKNPRIMMRIILKNFDRFQRLKELNLDLKAIGIYTDFANACLVSKTAFIASSAGGEENLSIRVSGKKYRYRNSTTEILISLDKIKKLKQINPSITINAVYKNIEVSTTNNGWYSGPASYINLGDASYLSNSNVYGSTIKNFLENEY